MNVYEFISKLENNEGLKAVNFDKKKLINLSLYKETGVGIIDLANRKKVTNLPDLKYYVLLKTKNMFNKLLPLLEQHFINNVYVLNDGQIVALITNTNQEKIVITDIALDNEFTTDNSFESLVAWFNQPATIVKNSKNIVAQLKDFFKNDDDDVNLMPDVPDMQLSPDDQTEYLSMDDVNQILDNHSSIITEPIKKVTITPQPVREFGEKVILVVDRFITEQTIRKTFSLFPNKKQYQDASIYNFYAMLDDEGNSYLLQYISLLEQIKINPEKQLQLYQQMQDICKKWFEKIKSLGITDICSKRVFKSVTSVTPENVIWLWSYFVLGQGCNWILANGNVIRGMKNEFAQVDIKEGQYYVGEARKTLMNTRPYVVKTPAQYMTVGCVSYLVDTGYTNNSIEWQSDHLSLESHIIGAMGNYNRTVYKRPIEEQIHALSISSKLELYKNFVKAYYKVL